MKQAWHGSLYRSNDMDPHPLPGLQPQLVTKSHQAPLGLGLT